MHELQLDSFKYPLHLFIKLFSISQYAQISNNV